MYDASEVPNDDIHTDTETSSSESEEENIHEAVGKNEEHHVKYCLHCVYELLYDYRLYVAEYKNLFYIYKFLTTLPMTQVGCERCFSKMKIIKTRLRSTMGNENLETFMLMSCEKDLLEAVNEEVIINNLCKYSAELTRLLML